MEADLVTELPTGDWQYEPKWDGFRGILENDGGELCLWSRNERPLLRYFPELEPLGKILPPHSALDGEIVISKKGQLDFDSMQMRLHPAESRIRKLSAEIPAQFIVFDILLWKGEKIHELPLEKRRKELERKAKRFQLSPYSRDLADAERWLDRLEAAGLDGVVAKRLGMSYLPGSRDGVVKVKKYKTADCVIVGFRYSEKAEGRISTLLLGLYGDDGELDFVGHCSGITASLRKQIEDELPKLRAPGFVSDKRIPGGQSRWTQGRELDWNPVRPSSCARCATTSSRRTASGTARASSGSGRTRIRRTAHGARSVPHAAAATRRSSRSSLQLRPDAGLGVEAAQLIGKAALDRVARLAAPEERKHLALPGVLEQERCTAVEGERGDHERDDSADVLERRVPRELEERSEHGPHSGDREDEREQRLARDRRRREHADDR